MVSAKKPIYVLGTGLSHDGSACLLKDGKICVAIEKERITRKKHDGGSDNEAIQYCLNSEGIGFDDIDLVVQNDNFSNLDRGNAYFRGIKRIIPEDTRVVSISHHLAHAYSVVGTSPFDEMAILIVDGCGSSWDDCHDLSGAKIPMELPESDSRHLYFEKDSYYHYKDGVLRPIYKDFSPFGYYLKGYSMCPSTTKHSIGGVYAAVSKYVFQGMEDVGKLMGLAPYGKPGVYSYEIFSFKEGRIFVNYDWMDKFKQPRLSYEDLHNNFQYYADIAHWVQREIEKALLYLFEERYQTMPCENIGFAGGVALNAVANAKIQAKSKFKNHYFQPAAGDNGLSIGCAYYGWMEVLKKERVKHNGSPYMGKPYESQDIESALDKHNRTIKWSKPKDITALAVDYLLQGKVLAWFEGGSEFGARALGHRSIIADPRNPKIRDFINREVKFREDFRPFAPSVPREYVSTYFDCDFDSPYMILVAQTRDTWKAKIPAVVHADDSARIQTVTEELSPSYYQLLMAFGKASGVYILLNTSFNRKGMPIVETPKDAIDFFKECALDALVIDGFMIEKIEEGTDSEDKNEDNHSLKEMECV